MPNEFRVFGPPGTGKTSRLATRDIPRAVEKYGKDKVMVTSYTKAAAREISFKKSRKTGKRIGVDEKNVGTMHSILYHALGQPEITEVHYIKDWNRKYPHYQITGRTANMLDEVQIMECNKDENGDKFLSTINILRNRMVPMTGKSWHREMKFYEKWVQFKQETGSVDFTDLIEMGYNEFDIAPNNPSVIFVDEAQDFTRLQLTTVRKWSANTEWIILVGDDDQCLYSFIGAEPDVMFNPPVSDEFKTVLKQSYRVPQEVLTRAMDLIIKVDQREKKEYFARLENDGSTAKGEIIEANYTYREPEQLIDIAGYYIEKGMDVAFLASCSYMLEPIKAVLKKRALPFQNKYRRRRRDWNPLHQHGTLNDFLDQGPDDKFWTVPQFVSWAKHLKVGQYGLIRGVGKKGLKRLEEAILENEEGLHTCREVLSMLLSESAIKPALERNVDWLLENIQGEKADSLRYPVDVYKEHGKNGVENDPKISIGTIHSVKGATFDVVFLFPDLSYIADAEIGVAKYSQDGTKIYPGRDAAYRMFYVGMTRAKHTLVLCRPNISLNPINPRMYVPL